jgi:hypothetical protein
MATLRRGFLIVLIVCGCSAAAPAQAAEGLFLTWNDCALAPGSVHDLQQSCTSNLGGQDLLCAFRMPFPTDSVLGVELVVDVQHADASLPDWWRFDTGGCRAGNLRAGFDFSPVSPCVDFFLGNAAGGLQGYYLTEPRGGINQARIKVAASLLPSVGYVQLDSTSMYYGARLTVTNALTEGATSCAGCLHPACLVLNSILVRRQPGAGGGDIFLSGPGPNDANWATWQGGTGADCAAVPARAVTWGQVKGLYR